MKIWKSLMFRGLFSNKSTNIKDNDWRRLIEILKDDQCMQVFHQIASNQTRNLPLNIADKMQEAINLSYSITSKTNTNSFVLIGSIIENKEHLIDNLLSEYKKALDQYVESNRSNLIKIIKWADKFDIPKFEKFDSMVYKESGIPRDIQKLAQLKFLMINKELSITYIPEELYLLPSLQAICIDNNHIENIPASLFNSKSIYRIDLEGNNIKEIPDEIEKMTSLRNLDLDGNNLQKVSSKILRCQNLKELRISNQKHGHKLDQESDIVDFSTALTVRRIDAFLKLHV